MMKYKTRKNEEHVIRLFSECKPFSEHFVKWEDKLLPDKYDQNFFAYSGQPTKEEFAKAVLYQKKIAPALSNWRETHPFRTASASKRA